jgi:hypothetical protein
MSRRLHRIATLIGSALASVAFLSFALGEIRVEASGLGAHYKWISLGQERAKDIVYWDRTGLGNIGWDTARTMYRTIGEQSGLGYNFASRWLLVPACGSVVIGVGVLGYYLTLVAGWFLSKIIAEQVMRGNRR